MAIAVDRKRALRDPERTRPLIQTLTVGPIVPPAGSASFGERVLSTSSRGIRLSIKSTQLNQASRHRIFTLTDTSMSFCLRDARPSRVPTRLEAALARLDRSVRKSVRHNEAMESMFTEWQSRWATRRDDIVRRLEAIDSQLNVWRPAGETTPRFAVVRAVEEGCLAQ